MNENRGQLLLLKGRGGKECRLKIIEGTFAQVHGQEHPVTCNSDPTIPLTHSQGSKILGLLLMPLLPVPVHIPSCNR